MGWFFLALTLAIADAGDGSGGTATIGGGTSGTNTLYVAADSGKMGALSFTLVGTRTGDGTIALANAVGYYVWYATNALTCDAGVVRQNLTDAADKSIQKACQEAFVQGVNLLGLQDIASVNVFERWFARAIFKLDITTPGTLPLAVVCPWDREDFPGVLTGKDDIGHPVAVCFFDKQNQDYKANLNRNTLWRQKVLSYFRYQRLAGVSPDIVYNVLPSAGPIIDEGWFRQNYYFSALYFRCVSRTTRGITGS